VREGEEKGEKKPWPTTEEAMPVEGTRMARLWEREVGRLPPKRFADAFMASEVHFHPSILPAPSQLHSS
jgi:hypothetical protein